MVVLARLLSQVIRVYSGNPKQLSCAVDNSNEIYHLAYTKIDKNVNTPTYTKQITINY